MSDRIEQAIKKAYLENKGSKHRVRVELDKCLNIAILKIQVGSRVTITRYLDGVEIFSSWMVKHDRIPVTWRMVKEGYTYARIGLMLGFSASTIAKDMAYLREQDPAIIKTIERLRKFRTLFNYADTARPTRDGTIMASAR